MTVIKRAISTATKLAVTPKNQVLDLNSIVGWHSVGNTLTHYANDNYENGYSSIRAIANRFMILSPYAIDEKGMPLAKQPNVIQCLSRPNEDMSGVDFRDALAVMTMVHDSVYILVHERYGAGIRPASENVREDRIAGFTFLENVLEVTVDGETQYEVYSKGKKDVYYPYQVIVLRDVNPNNLSKGYSPARAAKRWTNIDDYIADYQSGFFKNGAVPAGQFIITAPTDQEFNDIVDGLEKKHKGAGKNNNVVYTYQPIDPNTGKAAQATITWVPFNTNNKDMALKDLFEQANKKIDSVYGVSAFIRAIDEAPNFATAQVIERNFVENTVRPFAIKKYGRLQHELNRITGGLGYGIAFDLETPNIAEEEKAEAETNSIRVATINALVMQGYSLDSAIEALQLPKSFRLLKQGAAPQTVTETTEPGELPTNKGAAKRTNPKAELTDEESLELAARNYLKAQVDRAVKEYKATATDEAEPTDDELETFINQMMLVVSGILLTYGAIGYDDGLAILAASGVDTSLLSGFTLTDEATNSYRLYLEKVGRSFGDGTSDAIKKVLSDSQELGYTRAETEKALKSITDIEEYRVKRIGRTELQRSQQMGNIEGMKSITEQTGIQVQKVWHVNRSDACDYCKSMNGTKVSLEQPFIPVGGAIVAEDGSILVNDFVDIDIALGHPNCTCSTLFELVE